MHAQQIKGLEEAIVCFIVFEIFHTETSRCAFGRYLDR